MAQTGRWSVAVLELTNISKHFGAIHAVSDVSFTLEP
ncbi:MAG TPA: sugar ABC transporter ATP-binding protein, partial [Alphaproteobacteria bacterium]|nr:sugar ABC transporter ATP-binding protein [Alphaproteobacteria bacterium]